MAETLAKPTPFSKYVHEEWGTTAGESPHQRRVRHLLGNLGLDPSDTPASNIVFVRSRQERDIPAAEARRLQDDCWEFHVAMIKRIQPKVILCLGGTAGDFVRDRLSAHTEVDRFVEAHGQHWSSITYTGSGPTVVRLTHPSRASWTNPAADPSALVLRALARQQPG